MPHPALMSAPRAAGTVRPASLGTLQCEDVMRRSAAPTSGAEPAGRCRRPLRMREGLSERSRRGGLRGRGRAGAGPDEAPSPIRCTTFAWSWNPNGNAACKLERPEVDDPPAQCNSFRPLPVGLNRTPDTLVAVARLHQGEAEADLGVGEATLRAVAMASRDQLAVRSTGRV
jgi:hypothetical protein